MESREKLDITNLSIEEINEKMKIMKGIKVDIEEDKKFKDEFDNKLLKDIILDFSNKYNTDQLTALVAITKIIQDGGTNACIQNMTRKIKGIEFELSDLRQVIKLHDEFGTVRKLAKSIRKIIVTIARTNNWPGPLYKDLQRINPTMIISNADAVWCSEFNSDNYDPNMPAKIREALQQREQRIREDRNKYFFQRKPIDKIAKRKRGKNKKY